VEWLSYVRERLPRLVEVRQLSQGSFVPEREKDITLGLFPNLIYHILGTLCKEARGTCFEMIELDVTRLTQEIKSIVSTKLSQLEMKQDAAILQNSIPILEFGEDANNIIQTAVDSFDTIGNSTDIREKKEKVSSTAPFIIAIKGIAFTAVEFIEGLLWRKV